MQEDRITQRTVTAVMIVIALLAFVFSFGNVWSLALRLGVPEPIAPLIAPMVDLSVVGLLVALRYLSLRGVPAGEMKAATRLMHLSGLLTLALNVAEPIAAGHYGRAAVDAVAPLLLLGWGTVGPQLLRHFSAVAAVAAEPALQPDASPVSGPLPTPAPVLQPVAGGDGGPDVQNTAAPLPAKPLPVSSIVPAVKPPEPLLAEARSLARAHEAEHGTAISAAQLKVRLGVGLPMATALHSAL
ncbi:DUF2637 domain-containing protein [Streptomyces sp. NPDC004609]|uniref:DUF2637 domain-containing protein n=1 Tax=Streptomyces sp. NPDC004609 TaxID=3364704 RepID=UPI0036792CBA